MVHSRPPSPPPPPAPFCLPHLHFRKGTHGASVPYTPSGGPLATDGLRTSYHWDCTRMPHGRAGALPRHPYHPSCARVPGSACLPRTPGGMSPLHAALPTRTRRRRVARDILATLAMRDDSMLHLLSLPYRWGMHTNDFLTSRPLPRAPLHYCCLQAQA